MASDVEKKRAENEAKFRDANEEIRAAERDLGPPMERVPYLCECDDVDCQETIRLTTQEYEGVREQGTTFVIVAGHPSDGEIVEELEQYVVVRKRNGGGEVASALDPRKEEA